MMRSKRLALAAILVVLGSSGCILGYADPDFLVPSTREEQVREAAEAFGANLRWDRHEYAAAFVTPDERNAFLMLVRDPKAPVQFTDFQLLNVELGDKITEATALMSFKLYRLPSAIEVQLLDEQKWKYDGRRRRWFLQAELDVYRNAGKETAGDQAY